MGDVTTHRMTLDVLHDRHLLLATDLKVDDGVHAGIGGERLAQVHPRHVDADRVLGEPVDHGGNALLATESPARPGAGLTGRVCGEDDLAHGRTFRRGERRMRGSGGTDRRVYRWMPPAGRATCTTRVPRCRARQASGQVVAAEYLADRGVAEDGTDGPGDEWGHRQHLDQIGVGALGQGQGVRDDHLLDRGGSQTIHRGP